MSGLPGGRYLPRKEQLHSDERLLWRGKPAMAPFILPGLVSLLITLIPILYVTQNTMAKWQMPRAGMIFVLFPVILLVGLLMSGLLLRLLASINSEYVITNQRVFIRSGAIIPDTKFIDLNKIQGVFVNTGPFDAHFGTGTITIVASEYAYGKRPRLASIREPYKVQQLLEEALALINAVPSITSTSSFVQRCPQCGKESAADIYFCPTCGAGLTKEAPSARVVRGE
jgi:membrane protein YdbS with pleckstrin-like domain